MKEELEEARFWISQQEEWRSRAEWLEKNFRPVPAVLRSQSWNGFAESGAGSPEGSRSTFSKTIP
ncbi:MAG: hypothetical protein EB079_06770 [Verrucomicrobia bacterium]|nr:hypothetical protein [Verrucomicrobiota bacterium]